MSKRLGFFTGKIYGEEVPVSSIKECCEILTEKDTSCVHTNMLIQKQKVLKERCRGCNACEESQK